ncbi:MAG: ABC transporter ATP-binding protein [Candidatus Bathyarchaeia archaeon]
MISDLGFVDGLVKVTLENVTKRFWNVVAVNDVNLEVRDGEFFVLVGPNGCGKTTLLRLIAGLIKPDRGNIYFDDALVNRLKPVERGVRMVFQTYALYPHMKVFDEREYSNLNFALKIRKYMSDRIRNIVERVADDVGIERSLFDRKPDELSHGQRQRVAVGRAITIPPKVFLLDEPMSNLDPPSRVRVMKEIRRIHEELRTTSIYVTQNLVEAMAMADRMAVMREGAIQQVGTPEEVRKHPVNEFVADFIRYYDYASYFRTSTG